ncbi:MAG TPA: ATP-grasp domain-containing protein [Herpetosiphonaceae bacterium]
MQIVFCADPLAPRQPDPAYAAEAAAAEQAGLAWGLVQLEELLAGDERAAVRKIPAAPEGSAPALAVYRGWMLRPDDYARLYAALERRGLRLLNDPAAYRHCHWFPESYPLIAGQTPASVWMPAAEWSLDAAMERLAPFGDQPLILKDYVKSRKHEWHEACFIPAASDRAAVGRVSATFLERQGADLNEGLVYRAFVEFAPLGAHPQSGMPLTREFRQFYLDGAPLLSFPYWESGDYAGAAPPASQWAEIAAGIRSRFWTMDVAQLASGAWQIVELGDGQVAGLPDHADPAALYRGLAGVVG